MILAIPAALWMVASWLLVNRWSRGPGSRLTTMDPPARLLAAAVATLPEHRRPWGAAMAAELAEVRGSAARWRFALSCAGAALWLPRAGRWPLVALLSGVAVAAVTAAGPIMGIPLVVIGVTAGATLSRTLAGATINA